MSFQLVWKKEIIESNIEDLDTAQYLRNEYQMAFNDKFIEIVKE